MEMFAAECNQSPWEACVTSSGHPYGATDRHQTGRGCMSSNVRTGNLSEISAVHHYHVIENLASQFASTLLLQLGAWFRCCTASCEKIS